MPLTFRLGDRFMRLSRERDNFDVTFREYSSNPDPSAVNITAYPIPPIVHSIFIGDRRKIKPSWEAAGYACRRYHPGYQFEHWDDDRAAAFVQREYPEIWPTWNGYRYNIQRADSLRYMVLHHYGGIFLDMDLHCRRPLTPLRQFDFVAPGAYPTGISNGFIMSKAKLPFLAEVVNSLPSYDLSWFGLPYATVSFSTGCHYFSTMHAFTHLNRASLRILWGPEHMHHLNGNVSTPVFDHLGSSSWHDYDAQFFKLLSRPSRWPEVALRSWQHAGDVGRLVIVVVFWLAGLCTLLAMLRLRSVLKMSWWARGKHLANDEDDDEEQAKPRGRSRKRLLTKKDEERSWAEVLT